MRGQNLLDFRYVLLININFLAENDMLGCGKVLSEYLTDVSTQMKDMFQDARLSSVRPDTPKWPEMQRLLRPKKKQSLTPEVKNGAPGA